MAIVAPLLIADLMAPKSSLAAVKMILIKCEDRFADLGHIRSACATGLFNHAGWLD